MSYLGDHLFDARLLPIDAFGVPRFERRAPPRSGGASCSADRAGRVIPYDLCRLLRCFRRQPKWTADDTIDDATVRRLVPEKRHVVRAGRRVTTNDIGGMPQEYENLGWVLMGREPVSPAGRSGPPLGVNHCAEQVRRLDLAARMRAPVTFKR